MGDYRYQDGTHRLTATGNAERTVDASGHTTGRALGGDALAFTYDDRSRLTAASRGGEAIATYLYNATGERLAKRLAGQPEQRFFYNEVGQLIAERSDATRDYVWLGGIPVAVIDTTDGHSTLHAIHADHLGTPRVITDGEGKTVWSWSLHDDPFGENAPTSTSGYTFHLRFAGQYYDQETGLHYNLQRYYDPTVGRYLTSDPMGLSAGINTYAYVHGNPLGYIDAYGLSEWRQGAVDFFASVLNEATWGVSGWANERWNLVNVDECSGSYAAGQAVMFLPGLLNGKTEAKLAYKGIKRVTKTDALKRHILNGELDAARRESLGQVVARKTDGTPWNHVQELREAQAGLLRRIEYINKQLARPNITSAQR